MAIKNKDLKIALDRLNDPNDKIISNTEMSARLYKELQNITEDNLHKETDTGNIE